jgi:sulfhydrogenase subunit beta (sulfur reductase)
MELRYLTKANLASLIDSLEPEFAVFVPQRRSGRRMYGRLAAAGGQEGPRTGEGAMIVGEVRPVEPLKTFFFRNRQKVAEGFQDTVPGSAERPLCLVGVKACDLRSLRVLDAVFRGPDYRDPFYMQARERSLILSADCTSTLESCFCLALGLPPFPEADFDLNLSEVEGGFLTEAGSEKGRKLVEEHRSLFQDPPPGSRNARERLRSRISEEVRKNLQQFSVPEKDKLAGAIRKAYEAPLWREEAQACVECGACNTICPTCHCFLLFDQVRSGQLSRFRLWDSCLLKDFARVAGGANPRPQLWMRLRNRFEKKFDFFPQLAGIYACTGCGRCILACPAKIDIREVLKRNVEYVQQR